MLCVNWSCDNRSPSSRLGPGWCCLISRPDSALLDLTLDQVLDEVCALLGYDDAAAEKLCDRAIAFFDEQAVFTVRALL
jgi:hypothetical protein